jgi:hypothetical protein
MRNICITFTVFSSDVCKDILVINGMPENLDFKHCYYSTILIFKDLHLHMRTQIEIYFMYLGNKGIYFIFKTYCIICVLFSRKYNLFCNFIYFCSNNTHGFH